MATVTVYSTPTCTYCKRVKAFFEEHKVPYTDFNVSEDEEKLREMIEKSGQMGVPVIDVDGEIIVGFDEPRLRRALHL